MEKLYFKETPLSGAWIIKPKPYRDGRGQMSRTFCRNELLEHGIDFQVMQTNSSINLHAGTLRGMHAQVAPAAKSKIVRCVRGSVYDVIIDMRPHSDTYLQHVGVQLSAENMKMVVIPENFYHGFLTLEDNSELNYLVNNFYAPQYGRGMRYDDPVLGIQWPEPIQIISEKDKNWPLLEECTDDYNRSTT